MTKEEENQIIAELRWEEYPKRIPGGQSVGVTGGGVTLISDSMDIRITIAYERSQLKNKETALELFRKFLEIKSKN